MLRYIGKRILSLIPVMIVVSFVAFLIVYMIPGGPASSILGLEATADEIHALNAQLGFDRPFFVQYGDWIVGVLHGCLLYTSDAADDVLCVDLGGRRGRRHKKMMREQCRIRIVNENNLQ